MVDSCKNWTEEMLPGPSTAQNFTFPPYNVPTARTTYVKYAFDFPSDQDYYAVKFKPVIMRKEVVHHMLLYACDSESQVAPYRARPTDEGGMPCTELIFAWAVGGSTFCSPPNVGFLRKKSKPLMLLEVHYDNPNALEGVVDTSGLELTYFAASDVKKDTPFSRAGWMWIGANLPSVKVPPNKKNYHVQAQCKFESLPSSGVTTFAYILHAHLLGRKMWTEVS